MKQQQLIKSLQVETCKTSQFSGGNICVSSCGSFLFCPFGSSVNIIDIATGQTRLTLESDEEHIDCLLLSPDDKHLITAHRNLLLKQWNWHPKETANGQLNQKTSKCVRTWKAIHTAPILTMQFDSSSTLLATGSSDFTTKIWDIDSQYCTHNLRGHESPVTCMRFFRDLKERPQCVTACDQGKIRVFDLAASKQEACLDAHYSTVTCLEYLDDNRLLSSSRDKVLIIWNLQTSEKTRTLPIYESIEAFLLFGENELVTMGNEGILKLWDLKKGTIVAKQSDNDSLKVVNKRSSRTNASLELIISQGIYNAATSTIIQTTADQMIIFTKVDLTNLAAPPTEPFVVLKRLIGSHGEILDMTLAVSQDQTLLAMCTNNEFVKVYNLNTWDCQLLRGHTDLILSVAGYVVDETCSYLASSSKDATVRVWKLKRRGEDQSQLEVECVKVCEGHTQDVGAVAFSRLDLSFMVTASIDTTMKLWKISTDDGQIDFRVKFTVKAHEKDINSVCVSPNDKLIASCSSDKTAKVWDSLDGTILGILRGHKRGIWHIQFSTVDQLVATSSADATIKLWSLVDFSCVKVT